MGCWRQCRPALTGACCEGWIPRTLEVPRRSSLPRPTSRKPNPPDAIIRGPTIIYRHIAGTPPHSHLWCAVPVRSIAIDFSATCTATACSSSTCACAAARPKVGRNLRQVEVSPSQGICLLHSSKRVVTRSTANQRFWMRDSELAACSGSGVRDRFRSLSKTGAGV